MKVVYNTIVDDIDDIINQAKIYNRTVKEIMLTYGEWMEYKKIKNLQLNHDYFYSNSTPIEGNFLAEHKGVKLTLEK